MIEIKILKVTRAELTKDHYYYNGCTCSDMVENAEQKEEILNLTANVLIQILMKEWKEDE